MDETIVWCKFKLDRLKNYIVIGSGIDEKIM